MWGVSLLTSRDSLVYGTKLLTYVMGGLPPKSPSGRLLIYRSTEEREGVMKRRFGKGNYSEFFCNNRK